eukprot:TRINITY_DN13542_c0_g1_i2.p1 TRINITY_DN13542_c0_g1~~TRINITY_DN13542_c0_g1_i2.p1  ORF type:complete len:346 (+),score=54.00 TRINITY_DN13542_c0_g1_i2:110-1147(+)
MEHVARLLPGIFPRIGRRQLLPILPIAGGFCRAFMSTSEAASGSLPGEALPWLLCTDFDSTLTKEDTTRVLGLAAALHRGDAPEPAEKFLPKDWLQLEDKYLASYSTFMQKHMPSVGSSAAAAGAGLNRPGLVQFIEELQAFEEEAVSGAAASGVLRGMRRERLVRGLASDGELSELIEWRDAAPETLLAAAAAKHPLAVISVGWCREFIEAFLLTGLPGVYMPTANLFASNELVWSTDGVATGEIRQRVPGGLAKRVHLQTMREAHDERTVIYVGDSVTDLLALLEADLGIIVGESSSLARVAHDYGVTIKDLPRRQITPTRRKNAVLSWHLLASFVRNTNDFA